MGWSVVFGFRPALGEHRRFPFRHVDRQAEHMLGLAHLSHQLQPLGQQL